MYRLDADIEDALHSWAIHAINQVSIGVLSEVSIASLTGNDFIQVFWDKPNTDRPNYPYATLNILSGPEDIGGVVEKYKELDTWEYYTRKKITVQVNIYSFENWIGMLNLLINSLKLPSYRQIYQLKNLAFHTIAGLQDLSELLDTKYIGRAQCELVFSYPEVLTDKPGEIHKVTIIGTFDNEYEITDTINIDD